MYKILFVYKKYHVVEKYESGAIVLLDNRAWTELAHGLWKGASSLLWRRDQCVSGQTKVQMGS